jgi:hypothetical protein
MKIIVVVGLMLLFQLNLSAQVYFSVDARTKGSPISKDLIGVFFEDISTETTADQKWQLMERIYKMDE